MTALHTLRGIIGELRAAKPAKPAPRYLLCPGFITSRTDGDRHHISAEQLARLYGVPLDECLVLNYGGSPGLNHRRAELQSRAARGELLALYPRHSGDYTLPKQPHRNGCHNRAPYKPQVELHDHHGGLVAAFPFRMAPDCQYTLTALGQADAGRHGCQWRREGTPC